MVPWYQKEHVESTRPALRTADRQGESEDGEGTHLVLLLVPEYPGTMVPW
jgi:hypothetical protein